MNHTIPKEALTFFKALEKNNNRDWFTDHKKEFKAIEATIKACYTSLYECLKPI